MKALQEIDCNCNDCFFMKRDFATYKKWEDWHRSVSLKEFERKKNKLIEDAQSEAQIKSARAMVFQFNKNGLLQYGICDKLNKSVSFIPNTCQLDTQECFKHRKS